MARQRTYSGEHMSLTKQSIAAATLAVALATAPTALAAPPAAAPSAKEVQPLLIGSEVPAVTLADLDGKPIELRELVALQPTVLIFYRGGW